MPPTTDASWTTPHRRKMIYHPPGRHVQRGRMTHATTLQWTTSVDVPSLLSFHTSNTGRKADRLTAVVAPPHDRLRVLTPPMLLYAVRPRFALHTDEGASLQLAMPCAAREDARPRWNPSHGAFCVCTSCAHLWRNLDETVRPCGCQYDASWAAADAVDEHVQQHHFRHFVDDVDRCLRDRVVADSHSPSGAIGFGFLTNYRGESTIRRAFQTVYGHDWQVLDRMVCHAAYGADIPVYDADGEACAAFDPCKRHPLRGRVHLEYLGPRFAHGSFFWNKWRVVGMQLCRPSATCECADSPASSCMEPTTHPPTPHPVG